MAVDEVRPVMDSSTMEAVLWRDVWGAFQPVTSAGQRWKRAVQPWVSGQEDAWCAALRQLEEDAQVISDADLRTLREQLSRMPDLANTLCDLVAPAFVLQPKHALWLKQCAWLGGALAEHPAVQRMHSLTGIPWKQLLEMMGEATSPAFAVDHVGGAVYHRAVQALTEAVSDVAACLRARDAAWMETVGRRPTRDGQIILSLPMEAPLANALKQRADVRWVRDTPFESVFEVLSDDRLQAALQRKDAAQAELDACVAAVMRRLTDTVRRTAPQWQRAVDELCELDVRLAKVELLRRWAGCVPQAGEAVQMEGAIHPAIADALGRRGRAFTPLSWTLAPGVGVLCGSNMGGKTVAMATLCVCQLLAQFALPVPARRFQTMLVRCVRFCGDAETDARRGLSAFGGEVLRWMELWDVLQAAEPVLVCFDEPGKSTNPAEGEALTVGWVRCLVRLAGSGVAVMATHFAAPLREPMVQKFRVSGLSSRRLSASSKPNPPGARTEHEVATDDRLAQLEGAMHYRIESLGEGDVPREAVWVAEWLGAPELLLREARGFLERRVES
ncbi:MutS-related protein [Alicyclobacillus contaminans]|uniref:MutS-related protein n=1 Tax=Alicyclobacillus contaminans TaxID=392016 RepID=UPI00041E1887|nr:hypothetical protein [Alicyclobacillus contaminans]